MIDGGFDIQTSIGDHVTAQHIRSLSGERVVRFLTYQGSGYATASTAAWLGKDDLEHLIERLGVVLDEFTKLEATDGDQASS